MDTKKLMAAAITIAAAYGVTRLSKNPMVIAAAYGVIGTVVAKQIPFVNQSLA